MKKAFILRIISMGMVLGLAGCHEVSNSSSAAPGPSPVAAAEPTPDAAGMGLKIVDKIVGTGAVATAGHTVSVHYTGWLDSNHQKFDSSLDRGKPFEFTLGAGQVIKGWDMGVAGMKVGGKRTLTIPAELGYGAQGAGGVIPGGAALVFDVELLDVK